MAFTKTLMARGTQASYLRVASYRWDESARAASALFALYVDRAHAQRREQPLLPIAAKVRIYGDAFDRYLGKQAMAEAAANAGSDTIAHLYQAAKDASLEAKRTGKTDPEIHVISDFGPDLFADAKPA